MKFTGEGSEGEMLRYYLAGSFLYVTVQHIFRQLNISKGERGSKSKNSEYAWLKMKHWEKEKIQMCHNAH